MNQTEPLTPQKPRYRIAKNYPFRLPVRVTPVEREILWSKAKGAGMSISRFVARTICEGRYPPTLKDSDALFRTRFLLEKVGTNLNQIAHRLNAAAKGAPVVPPTFAEIRQVVQMVKAVAKQIKEKMR